ncbi:hypothetical protein E2C01_012879 [Portunus trituberculatus]|uniref:Uncharacterized protein n=1 Tax=Portunus trituberculatus TaxID=210409 RepID=A0A5B7DEV1_PORTR|nr:hypothetical protein [Portunus trituberculatus]
MCILKWALKTPASLQNIAVCSGIIRGASRALLGGLDPRLCTYPAAARAGAPLWRVTAKGSKSSLTISCLSLVKKQINTL